jgi:hypothetical protein
VGRAGVARDIRQALLSDAVEHELDLVAELGEPVVDPMPHRDATRS